MTASLALLLILTFFSLECLLVIAVLLRSVNNLKKKKQTPKTTLVSEPVFCKETGCECSSWPDPESDMESHEKNHWSDLFPQDTYIRTWLGPQGWQVIERSGNGTFWLGSDKRRYSHKRTYQIARDAEAAQVAGLQKKYPAKTNRKSSSGLWSDKGGLVG